MRSPSSQWVDQAGNSIGLKSHFIPARLQFAGWSRHRIQAPHKRQTRKSNSHRYLLSRSGDYCVDSYGGTDASSRGQ
jgi:hypothetical protein